MAPQRGRLLDLRAHNVRGRVAGTGNPTTPYKTRVDTGSGWNSYTDLM